MCRLPYLAALVCVLIAAIIIDVKTVGAVSLPPESTGTTSATTATTVPGPPTTATTVPGPPTTATTVPGPSTTAPNFYTAHSETTADDTTTTATEVTSTTTTTTTNEATTVTTTATTTATELTTPKENCTAEQKRLACELLQKYSKNLVLTTAHASGVSDNAFARDNVKDMCDGKQAARSSYKCKECPTGAPGGTVCIRESVLKYIAAVAAKGRVRINEIAGACHSCTSRHYQGLAVDLDHGARRQEYLDMCRQMGGTGIDERNHIHCQFNN